MPYVTPGTKVNEDPFGFQSYNILANNEEYLKATTDALAVSLEDVEALFWGTCFYER
jgi:hypothetical protein